MTEDQMKAKIKELEDQMKAKDSTISSLESQRSNQNAYITKLEQKNKSYESNMNNIKETVNNTKEFPPEVVEYFQKKRREDYTEQGYAEIKRTVSPEVFSLLKPEVDKFLATYMTENNVSVKYVIDAFHLLLGTAYADPKHPINKLGAKEEPAQAPVKPAVDNTAIANEVAKMQNPGMVASDQAMANPVPTQVSTASNTKEALNAFRTRLLNGFDSTKFE